MIPEKSEGALENYMLAVAYRQKEEYRNAIFYFARAAFERHNPETIRPFPAPVESYLRRFGRRSVYYDDAVYGIAEIFSLHGEHEYVVRILRLVRNSETAIYRESVLLSASSLIRMDKGPDAIDILRNYIKNERYRYPKEIARIRLASAFNLEERYREAALEYLKVVAPSPSSWQAVIASRELNRLLQDNRVLLKGSEPLYAAGGFVSAELYEEALSLLDLLKAENPELLSGDSKEGVRASILEARALAGLGRHSGVENLVDNGSDEKNAAAGLAAGRKYESLNQQSRALSMYQKTVDRGREPYAGSAMAAILELNRSRALSDGYINDYRRFKELYPENRLVQRYAWEIVRAHIRNNTVSRVNDILIEALEVDPESFYSDNFRYWIREIALLRGEKERASRVKMDLVRYNPDSAYAWVLLADKAAATDHAELKGLFEVSIQEGDHQSALLYNALLYLKERDISARNKRISRLDHPDIKKWDEILADIKSLNVSKRNRPYLENLEKYFKAGDRASITRELSFIEEDPRDAADKRTALVHYGSAANIPRYFVTAFEQLYPGKGMKENQFIMPEELIRMVLPRPFSGIVKRSAAELNVDPEHIWAVMKAESMFAHDARSSVNAAGLMQIMPATGKELARYFKISDYSLTDPETSIRFGAKYLSDMNRMFGGDFHKTAAAYNAGPGNLRRWMSSLPQDDIIRFADNIPFRETRLYVLKTTRFLLQYKTFHAD